jgi:hypothetical protein
MYQCEHGRVRIWVGKQNSAYLFAYVDQLRHYALALSSEVHI